MRDYSVEQSSNIVPPRIVTSATTDAGGTPPTFGQVVAITVDATSRGYDLTQLLWGGEKTGDLKREDHFFVSFQTDSNNVYFLLDSAAVGTHAIDDTQAIAAGTALTTLPAGIGNAFPPAVIIAGLPPVDVRIERQVDKTLIVKCASAKTSILRFWLSSQRDPGSS